MMPALRTGDAAVRTPLTSRRTRVILVVVGLVLAAWAAGRLTLTSPLGSPPSTMSPECHQAYRGYMAATDPAEAGFWAESWMTFGCESGGYWA